MPFCTLVEFEWDAVVRPGAVHRRPGRGRPRRANCRQGCLSRITSIDDAGARVIEVWRSGDDARAFADDAGPRWPRHSSRRRPGLAGFEAAGYRVAGGQRPGGRVRDHPVHSRGRGVARAHQPVPGQAGLVGQHARSWARSRRGFSLAAVARLTWVLSPWTRSRASARAMSAQEPSLVGEQRDCPRSRGVSSAIRASPSGAPAGRAPRAGRPRPGPARRVTVGVQHGARRARGDRKPGAQPGTSRRVRRRRWAAGGLPARLPPNIVRAEAYPAWFR